MDNPFGGSGSTFDNLINSLAGRGYIDGSTWTQRPQQPAGPPMQLPGGMPQQHQMPQVPPQAHAYGLQHTMPPQAQGYGAGGIPPIQQPMPGAAPALPQGFQPANLGTIVPPIQQPIQGSAPALAQGFSPFSRQPSMMDMVLARRG